jgi:hypothetical protein
MDQTDPDPQHCPKLNFLGGRCALAVRKEWQSVDASILFWTTDLNDDPSLKLALVERISKLPDTTCMKCMCPKEMQRRL